MEHAEIISNKGKLEFILNGVSVLTTNYGDDNWKQMVAGSKFKQWPDFGTVFKGHFALQDHGNEVWFKNIMKKGDRTIGCLGRITDIKDLPADKIIIGFIKQAKKLNDDGIQLPARVPKADKKELVMPDYFMKAIKKNKKALETYSKFSPSAKREYIEWIIDAKTDETRTRRMETAVEWMGEGKQGIGSTKDSL
jgi:uncharacterized protein YdeI (YjbR/CyaY-like superfamily)